MRKRHKGFVFKFTTNLSVFVLLTISLIFGSVNISNANEYLCSNFKIPNSDNPNWTFSEAKDLRIVFVWNIHDPNKCIATLRNGLGEFAIRYNTSNSKLQQTWDLIRSGDYVAIAASVEVPIDWLLADPNDRGIRWSGNGQLLDDISSIASLYDSKGEFIPYPLRGSISKVTLWGVWFSKNQGLKSSECQFPSAENIYSPPTDPLDPKYRLTISDFGLRPTIKIEMSETRNCIFLVHSGPVEQEIQNSNQSDFLAEKAFWDSSASNFFPAILNSPNKIVQIGFGNFGLSGQSCNWGFKCPWAKITSKPNLISHTDSVISSDNSLTITSSLDLGVNPKIDDLVGIYIGYYYWYSGGPTYTSGGWTINWKNPSSFTARYNRGGYDSPLRKMQYQTHYITIPVQNLLLSPQDKAAADKAAADKAAADKAAAKVTVGSKSTITCTKGKLTKKVTASNPKCPAGFKRR